MAEAEVAEELGEVVSVETFGSRGEEVVAGVCDGFGGVEWWQVWWMYAGVDDVFAFVLAATADACVGGDDARAQGGQGREWFDRGAWWKCAVEGELGVDDCSYATCLWIDNDDRALACAECVCSSRLQARVVALRGLGCLNVRRVTEAARNSERQPYGHTHHQHDSKNSD